MRLEIGNFYVKDIKFGDKLSFDDGVLTINKEKALDFIREDERITEADLYIAKPGDKIRMCPVKEAIEPRVRLDGRGLFPGYTSELAKAGDGVLLALKNCKFMSCYSKCIILLLLLMLLKILIRICYEYNIVQITEVCIFLPFTTHVDQSILETSPVFSDYEYAAVL